MENSVFFKFEFLGLILVSLCLPMSIYGYLMLKTAISRRTVLLFGVTLIVLAGINVYLLQHLAFLSRHSPSLIDDRLFASEVSLALYLLPVLFAGIGTNMISHILISHLQRAEHRFEEQSRQAKS
ncbi:MAG: hypothetical protein JSR19_08335 [Proteobacteria bacterium]|nr:hypothetical protein [Pseudomonadota bacterium]HQR04233.1 hypothetical protein [Rhodocyclaceae bacterium]